MRYLAVVVGVLVVMSSSAAARSTDGLDRDINGRIVYTVTNREVIGGDGWLTVSDPNGKRRKTIFRPPDGVGTVHNAAWSPHGDKVAVAVHQTDRFRGSAALYVVNPDGTGRHQIADDPALSESSPAWSPNELDLAYVTGGAQAGIYVARTDGTGGRWLVGGDAPTWSPDGKRIVFRRSSQLFVIELASSRVFYLAGGSAPDWGAGGILFVRNRAIWIMNPSGARQRRLSKGGSDNAPAWSPDGQKIVFTCGGDICVMNRNGTGTRKVTRTPGISREEGDPDWQPVPVINGTIHGTRFDDYLLGWNGKQVIEGNAGNDVIIGARGEDRLVGGPGDDVFSARDRERDFVFGGPGQDRAEADRRDRVRSVERVSTR
jgi:Tol biopolymer transport system component